MKVIRRLFQIFVLLTLFTAPTQWSFEILPKTYLCLADIFLAGAALFWLIETLVTKNWKRALELPPWPHFLFVGLAALSLLMAPDMTAAVKELVQLIEYFLVGGLVFEAFLREGGRTARGFALAVAGISFLIILVFAVCQYGMPSDDPMTVRGTFGNRNVLGGYFALLVPLAFAGFFAVRLTVFRVFLLFLGAVALGVTLSGAAWGAIVVALLALTACAGWKKLLPMLFSLAFVQVWIWPELPRENDLTHLDSVALYNEVAEVERRYPEWQAAINLSLTHPDLGIGLGNYQSQIGQYYNNIPRRTGPSEPDAQNLYLVILATCGVAGLFAYLTVLLTGIGAAGKAAADDRNELSTRWVAGGVATGILAFALTCIWHPLLVRGIGLPFVFLLILARHLNDPREEDADEAAPAGSAELK